MGKLREMQLLLVRIPKGKVTTYKEIARKLKIHPRYAGRLLRSNPCPVKYPCYKVVRSDGRLGGYTSKNGVDDKIRKLRSDGIGVENGRIDLRRRLFRF